MFYISFKNKVSNYLLGLRNGQQASEFESHRVLHSYGLVPHLSKKTE